MLRRLFNTFVETQSLPVTTAELLPGPKNAIPAVFKHQELESLNWLHSVAPCFPVKSDNITILHEPSEFYEALISKCENAKFRITLASLYLGTGTLERQLVSTMQKNLKTSNGRLKINILLDFTRGTRGEINSKSLLLPLLQNYSHSCKLSLYHTPALRGWTKRLAPPRWNELLGLQHMKLYLIDDTVIISGANLSNDYFTNRQDRYIMIEDAKLSNFYAEFISKVQEFSLQVNADDNIGLHTGWNLLPYKDHHQSFITNASEKILQHFRNAMNRQTDDEYADTWIFPLTEMGQLGIHHDSVVTQMLLSSTPSNSKMKLATGYFNLTKNYMDTLTNRCQAECTLLMAHPDANGFQGAKGPAGGIPAAYSLLARRFYNNLVKAGQQYRVSLMEYQRPGWSYHAKGLWYYAPNSSLPYLTLIGSSNFGERSVHRDLETQLCLVTINNTMQNKLKTEWEHLHHRASQAERDLCERPVPRWVYAVVGLFRNYF